MTTKLRTIGALATTLLATLGAASAAQATTGFTNPTEPNGYVYTNNVTPTFSFTGFAPNDAVQLETADETVVGTGMTDSSGNGAITPDSPLSSGFHRLYLFTYDTTWHTFDSTNVGVSVFVDQLPVIGLNSSFPDNVVDAPASFYVYNAIPSRGVQLNITQQGGSGSATVQATATNDGYAFNISPSVAPGAYTATATTTDAQGIVSDPSAPQPFYVAPAQPAIAAIDGQPASDNATANDANPNISLSGVLAGADVKLFTLDADNNPVQVAEQTAATGGSLDIRASGLADGPVSLYATQTIDENGTPVSSDGSTDHTPRTRPRR